MTPNAIQDLLLPNGRRNLCEIVGCRWFDTVGEVLVACPFSAADDDFIWAVSQISRLLYTCIYLFIAISLKPNAEWV
jgi:hypothetical protein